MNGGVAHQSWCEIDDSPSLCEDGFRYQHNEEQNVAYGDFVHAYYLYINSLDTQRYPEMRVMAVMFLTLRVYRETEFHERCQAHLH